MRFISDRQDGLQIFAVSGVNTVFFAVKVTAPAGRKLPGFA